MDITYNGIQGANNLVTFTDVPNILKVEDDGGGTYATFSLIFNGNLKSSTTKDGQWYITFLGETITNVVDYNNAVNKNFYVSTSSESTAASVCRAFRNCPGIYANFTIEHGESEVEIRARAVGSVWSGMRSFFETNIPAARLEYTAYDGSANSSLAGALINVNVIVNGKYITALAKNYYGKECAFDVSPVLTSVAKIGETVPYHFHVSYTKDGEYTYLGRVGGGDNHIAQGYMVNQGSKYLDITQSSVVIAQNFSRGTAKGLANNTILYLYGNTIPVTFYRNGSSSVAILVEYKNSAYETISSVTTSYDDSDVSNKLKETTLVLTSSLLERSFYVDVTINSQTIRYNVIKPVKATEYYQRIYWRNSYGGISFFDFTGQKSETRDVDVSTYQKSIFDYYSSPKNELEMIYDNDVKYFVTLKSHLFEKDGKYVFNDLMQSPYVWTVVNGEEYLIIIDSVSVEEQDRNDIYEATVKYRYSQKPSLI